jgi:MFS transporter, DHA1 family, tetracycline resistance protein
MTTPATESQSPASKPLPGGKSRKSALFIVFLVVFIDLLGFGIVLPLLPLYADSLLKPLFPGAHAEVIHGVILGLLMSAFSAMQFLFAPIWGRLSDRIGRRPILILGLVGSVVFYLLFGIASELGASGWLLTSLILLFVSRLGAGIAGATISAAQAVIADCTSPQERSRGMALIGAAFGIGFTFGPLVGLASLEIPAAGAPGYFAAGLSLIALLLAIWRLPETVSAETKGLRRGWLDWQGLRRALRTPTIGSLVVTFFLATFAFGSLESTLSLLNRAILLPESDTVATIAAESEHKVDKGNFLIFAFVGLVLVVVQGGIYRPMAKRVSELTFMRVGLAVMTVGLLCACLIAGAAYHGELQKGTGILYYVLPVLTLAVTGFAFLTPSVQSLISRRSDPNQQGEILGANQGFSALARILGPLIGLSTFKLEPSHITPYAMSAVLLFVVFLMSLRLR